MPVCLQGGAEFGPRCREMDAHLLDLAGGGRVVVTALAGAPGREHDTANANGVRHFRALGAVDVDAAPDARADEAAAYDACRSARLLVLPGGSPAELLRVLTSTRVGDAVAEVLAAGGVVSGASAGAMVLCAWTLVPSRARALVRGLGTVPHSIVLPHFRGDTSWLRDRALPEGVTVLGLPEQSGVLVDGSSLTALGATPSTLLAAADDPGTTVPVGSTVPFPPTEP